MSASRLVVPAFAKINLSLELLGRRRDAYCEVRTLLQTVTLHDRLRLRLVRGHNRIEVRVPAGGAPAGAENLVHRMLTRARRLLGVRRGIEVELEKAIPAGRGLGGGSSDAAAALLGLLRLTGERMELAEAAQLGAELGADVPFFLTGGTALGVGRGDEVYALADEPPACCVLVCPPLSISSRRAYGWVRGGQPLTLRQRPAIITDSQLPLDGLWADGNGFERVVFSRFPELARMKAALLRAGARAAGLSGSGSAVFALFERRAQAVRAAAHWAPRAAVFVVAMLPGRRYQRLVGAMAALKPSAEVHEEWGVVQR